MHVLQDFFQQEGFTYGGRFQQSSRYKLFLYAENFHTQQRLDVGSLDLQTDQFEKGRDFERVDRAALDRLAGMLGFEVEASGKTGMST